MVDVQALSPALRLDANGVWYGSDTQTVSYPSDGNAVCFAVEDGSFWFKHRNECIVAVVKRLPPKAHDAIFDIGGGNGFVSMGLERAGFEVVLLEPGKTGAANAKKREVRHVICATADTAGLPPGSVGAVGLFDVIEHIADDLSFLKSIRALMRPGGRVYVTVPAYAGLWSEEDDAAGHFRRYCLATINRVLEVAGFKIDFSSYIFRPLPVPIFFLRTLPYRFGLLRSGSKRQASNHAADGRTANTVLSALLRAEVEHLASGRSMRFGGSCLVVATAG